MIVHRTLIVPNQYVEQCRSLSVAIAGEAGAGMWDVPLSATGQPNATHWLSAGIISSEFASLLDSPQALSAAAQSAGAALSLNDAQALLSACTVRTENPFVVLDDVGLRIIETAGN
jgi:hypothetical protein